MTIGEKIKTARKQCNLSQEQLAEKLMVSRSAVAKWESDKGVPDIENLKALAQLLNVTVDYLINDDEIIEQTTIREGFDITQYGKGSKKKKKDRVIRDKFPNAVIHTLIGKLKLSKSEKIIDNVLGFFTDAPFGVPEIINSLKNTDKEFYLVEEVGKQSLVVVTDEFVEIRPMDNIITADEFEIDNWQFIKCKYEV